jgi:hypothetical protein
MHDAEGGGAIGHPVSDRKNDARKRWRRRWRADLVSHHTQPASRERMAQHRA